jgi:predicted HNH restriction endonuclease
MAAPIDKKIQDALSKLNNKQKKAVLGLVTAFSEEEEVYDHWKDKSFVAEMDRRYDEYKSGKVKLISLDDVEKKADLIAQKIKAKKAS